MNPDPGEAEVVGRAAAGDREAFGDLAHRHQAALRGYISRFICHPEEVFDLAQETFLDAYRSLSRFDPKVEFAPWLRGIARNLIREHLRRESRLRDRELRAFDETLRRWQADNFESQAGVEDRLDLLRDCVSQLDGESRSLIEERYLEGRAIESVAVLHRKSAGALAIQFMRIRAALAKCIQGKVAVAR